MIQNTFDNINKIEGDFPKKTRSAIISFDYRRSRAIIGCIPISNRDSIWKLYKHFFRDADGCRQCCSNVVFNF